MQSNLYQDLKDRRQARAEARVTAAAIIILTLAAIVLTAIAIIYQIPLQG